MGRGDLLKILYADGTTDINFLAYDRLGNLTQVQDATGTRTLEYQNGQLTKETLPDWFNNLVVGIDYETTTSPTTGTVAGTVKGRYSLLKLGTATEADREMAVTYGYDNFGRINGVKADYKARTSVRDALSVAASYQYTPRSSMWGTFTQGNFSVTRTPEPARDVLSSIASVHTTEGDLAIFGYGTDDAGRRQWAKQWGMAFGDFQDTGNDPTYYRYNYDAKGQLATDPDPNSGILAAQGYRGTDPTKADNPLPGRGFGYTYDSAGNRKTVSVSGDPVSYRNGPATTDAAGANALNQPRSRGTLKSRVSGTSDRNAAVTVGSITASREPSPGRYWDAALPTASDGQYASVTVSSTLAGATSETKTVQVLTRPANEELIWDDDGNLQKDSLWSYEYDAENRLKRMSRNPDASGWAPNRELLFTYDYLGRRVQKVAKLNNQTVYDRKYIYHGWALIAELDTATNKIVRSYAWGLDIDSSLGGTGGVGGLVLETLHTDTTLTAFHICYDGSGNVAALARRAPGTDADGQTAVAYEYGPFGEPLRVTLDPSLPTATRDELATQPFRFSTKYTDTETGLVYYGYRYYDPSMGRFINRDPIGEAGGNNLYGFVGNGPVNGFDFLGMEGDDKKDLPPNVVDVYHDWHEGSSTEFESSNDFTLNLPTEMYGASRVGRTDQDNKRLTNTPIIVKTGEYDMGPAQNSEVTNALLPIMLAASVRTGETNATIEGKAAHSGFGQGVKLSNDTITDRLSVGKNTVGVSELKPEGRLANTGKFNQAINQLYRQMAAAAEKFKGKTVEGSLWVWQKTGNGFKYVKVMTIKMGGAINGVLILPGVLSDAADLKELQDRARKNGRTVEDQNRIEMLESGPVLRTPQGRYPTHFGPNPSIFPIRPR